MEQENSSFPTSTGPYATPNLVGRTALLQRVEGLMQRPSLWQATLIFFTGDGGIGKTRFLLDILKRASNNPALIPARQIIDLYHIRNHTTDGLIESICDVLPWEAFTAYAEERLILERMRLAGDPSKLGAQHQTVFDTFSADLRRLAAEKPVVIALDTAERLLYATSHPAQAIGDAAESWQWLCDVLPTLPNLILLVAGRPESSDLQQYVEKQNVTLELDEIPPLSEDECLRYFEAVLQMDLSGEAGEAIERLASFDEEMRRTIAISAGGLPITLALLIDFLSVAPASQIPEVLKLSPAQAAQHVEADPTAVQNQLQEAFIRRILGADRIGDTILALGRLPKGADAELLGKVMRITPEEAAARLTEVRRLSIVKIRPTDERYFLHDLVYEMLREYVYDGPGDTAAGFVSEQVLEYYEDQLKRVQQKIAEWFQPVLQTGKPTAVLSDLTKLIMERQVILAEVLYYRLRQDTGRGFLRYYRYMREAILSGQTLLDLLLQIEMLTFWSERDPHWITEDIDGVPRSIVEGILEIRPVTRAWADGLYLEAIRLVDNIKRTHPTLFEQSRGTRSIFDGWKAFSLIMLGDTENLVSARILLDKGIALLTTVVNENLPEVRLWRGKAVLAFCYRVRGYLNRIQGNISSSVSDYRMAARLWRDLNFQIELGRTLNDLGFALSELGRNRDARALVSEAFAILEGLGQYTLAGLSVNTLAMIDIKQGDYRNARESAEKSHTIFRSLQYQRGIGLALIARAEATRRYSATAEVTLNERVERLRNAREYANEAVTIFEETHSEKDRLVEALIEVGCACRDWERLQRENPSLVETTDGLKEESKAALERAAEVAGAAIIHRHLDALVNLAWLAYYTDDPYLLESTTKRVENTTRKDYSNYYIDPEQGSPSVDHSTAQRLIWPQIGKLYTLHGFRILKQITGMTDAMPEREVYLRDSIRLLALGLEHSVLYSDNYQGLNQAKDQTCSAVQRLNLSDLPKVSDILKEFERDYSLKRVKEDGTSVMRDFLESRALL